MAREKIEKLIKREAKANSDMLNNRGLFEDVDDYMNPYRNTWGQNKQNTSHNKPYKQYDSTAMIAANNFVNTMVSNFTPVFSRWAEMKAGPGIPDENKDDWNKQLELLTSVVFTYLNASNFIKAAAEMYYELGKGTGIMFILEGDEQQPLRFESIPLSQVSLEEGAFGKISGIYRRRKMKKRDVKETYRDATLSDEFQTEIADKPDEEIEIKECIYWSYEDFVWYFDVVYEERKERIVERSYAEDVVLTPRWMKIPGFATGVGPFVMALPDTKTLNKMKELGLQLAALNAFGVYTVRSTGVFNPKTAKIRPGAFIPVESNGGPNGPSVQRLESAGNYNVQQAQIEDIKLQIRQIMLDNRLPPEDAPVRTAFEIAERIKELSTDIGAAFGRLILEFVVPLFRRVISILERKGLIKLPEGFEIDNFFVQVQVVSPIAQQQALEDIQKFMQTFGMVQQISTELAFMSYKIEDIPEWLTEKSGSTPKLLRDDKDKKKLQTMVGQLVAQQQQAAAGQQQGAPQAAPAAA